MSFFRHGLQTGIAQVITMGLGLFVGIIHARYLGAEGLGIYALLVLLYNLIYRIANFGFANSIKYYVGNRIYSFRAIYKFSILISIAVSVIGLFIGLLIYNLSIPTWADIDPKIYYLTLVIIPFHFLLTYSKNMLNAKLQITYLNLLVIFHQIIHLITLILFLIIFKMDVRGAVFSLILTEVFLVIMAQYKLFSLYRNTPKTKDDKILYADLFRGMWSYSGWSYFNLIISFFLQRAPVFLLKQYAGSISSIGLYSKARSLGSKTEQIAKPFNNLVFSYTANTDSSSKKTARINTLCRVYLFLLTSIAIILSLFIEDIIVFLYGTEFKQSAQIFYFIVPAIVLYPTTRFINGYFAATGFIKRVFFTNFITLLITIAIGYYLINTYDGVGAALTLSISYFMLFVAFLTQYVLLTNTKLLDVILVKRKDLLKIKPSLQNFFKQLKNKLKSLKK